MRQGGTLYYLANDHLGGTALVIARLRTGIKAKNTTVS